MSYEAIFEGWDSLTISDLLVAYRKAKADCYFENSFPTAIKFAEYEQNLLDNLNSLLDGLKNKKGFSKNNELLGDCRLVPKKLGIDPKNEKGNGHVHFSEPERAFDSLCEKHDLKPEFRIIGDFPVDAHILSALWINMVGHKFDACLDETSYGSRLRRVRSEETLDKAAQKPFHISAIGSFQPYFQPYQRWRNDGLKSIRNELENERKVIAVSLDLRSYYHLIDPNFFGSKVFQNEIGLAEENSLTDEELDFTTQLSVFLSKWAKKASAFSVLLHSGKSDPVSGGLVIGLTASRIISNALLIKWDQLVKEKITPVHYGRYVDDVFLVMHDPGTIVDSQSFMEYIQERLGSEIISNENDSDTWEIQLGKNYQKKTKIELQAGKQKLFILEGQAGVDLLDSIEKEINELSSEVRLMPAPDQLEKTTAAKVLSAAGSVGEQADNLRRADGLTIRRLGWSLQLRHVETLANDLPSAEWKKERDEFYLFAHNHILRPDKIFAHYQYLPRLLGFAISLSEWEKAEAILKAAFNSFESLRAVTASNISISINGASGFSGDNIWRYVEGSLAWSFIDAAAKNYPIPALFEKNPDAKVLRIAEIFMEQLWQALVSLEDILQFPFHSDEFHTKAPLLASTDLARKPYKTIISSKQGKELLNSSEKSKTKERKILKEFDNIKLLETDDIADFLNKTRKKRLLYCKAGSRTCESFRPYLFPTRPYTPSEIAALAPECVGLEKIKNIRSQEVWAKYVRAIRGVWVKPSLLKPEDDSDEESSKTIFNRRTIAKIGTENKKSIRVAITNFATSDESWEQSAVDKPLLTLDRYISVSNLVNQAIMLKPRPDYLILPELSLPLEWVNSISHRLISVGISLIAGTEYRHSTKTEIFSEACMELTDSRLGYSTSVRIWQPKLEPAVGEDEDLTVRFGKTWKKFGRLTKPVYKHNGFFFGVMVCSEIQNSKARIRFQGYVDALMILSWNQDLDTFSSLVEATALDIHAYTILVNNRRYGDSRVRSPAKDTFRRDIARLRGGENDFCVAVELDIEKLRAFQSRAKRWPKKDDPFKPVPEGFQIASGRKKLPPK